MTQLLSIQVFHSGIPVTLVPLDATNTIPVNENFFKAFEQNQRTYEAQYCFQSLKMARDTWFDDQFYTVMLVSRTFSYQLKPYIKCHIYLFVRQGRTKTSMIINLNTSFAELFHVGLLHVRCSSFYHAYFA